MTSKKTVAGVVKVLTEEVGFAKAKRIVERLCLVEGNQSYYNTVKAVNDSLEEIVDVERKFQEVRRGKDSKVRKTV